jgi:tetratricopeptide (TPR) repeat protein
MLRLARALPRAGRWFAASSILLAAVLAPGGADAQRRSTWEPDVQVTGTAAPGNTVPGAYLGDTVTNSAEECRDLCVRAPACAAWQWRTLQATLQPRSCFVFTAIEGRQKPPPGMVISGVVTGTAGPGADPGTEGLSVQELAARCSRAMREEPRSVIAACTAIIERESARVTNLDVVYHSRAIARSRLKQNQLALRDIEQSLRINPRNERSLEVHGNILAALKRYPEALDAYRRALEAAPADPGRYSIHRNRAITYVELRDVGAALSDLDRCIEIGPGEARCWSLRGELKAERGRNAEALADFDEALRLDPSFGQAYYRRSLVHRKMGNATQANADLAQSRRFGYRPSANKP